MELPKIASNSYILSGNAVVAGFGLNLVQFHTDKNTGQQFVVNGASDDKLRFAETTIIPNKICQLNRYDPIYPSHLCARVQQRNDKEPEGLCEVSLFIF